MSRTFSTNCGSVESLNVSVRCGCSENARQMRCTEEAETPDPFAMSRVLQCVAPVGFSSDDDSFDLVVADLARRAASGFVAETVEAVLCEPLSPRAHGLARDADLGGDCAVVEPIGGEQNDLRALRIATPDLAPPNETVKIGALIDAERDDTRLRCPARSHAGLRDSRHGLQNQSSAKVARNF